MYFVSRIDASVICCENYSTWLENHVGAMSFPINVVILLFHNIFQLIHLGFRCCLIICYMNRGSSVSTLTELWAGRPGFDFLQDQEFSLFSTVCRPALGPTESPIHMGNGGGGAVSPG
jgi:hypothetical protein